MSRVLQLAPGWGLGAQVHDFGFLAFDPGLLQFMKSGRIPLDPAAARVGLEVRVVGNDSGEKVRRVRPSSRSVPLRTLCHPSSPEGAAEQPGSFAGCGTLTLQAGQRPRPPRPRGPPLVGQHCQQ